MGRLFGTDGIRGVAGKDLNAELAMNIGKAAAAVLTEGCRRRPVFVIGTDTRISSDMLSAAVSAGLCSVGADVISLGVVPTPAVAYLVEKYKADAGVMISASHNTSEYNGIKIFSGDGFKLPDALEERIEDILLNRVNEPEVVSGEGIGKITVRPSAAKDYIDHLKSSVPYSLDGMRVAVDCANGSASVTAEKLFTSLGADVHLMFHTPDGVNINRGCGSTHMEALAQYVAENDLDAGVAFDGDRFVLEEMLLEDYSFGGEQSGHIIFRDFATTGDGQLTAIQLLSMMRRKGKKLSELSGIMTKYPQTMVNVRVSPEGKLLFYTDRAVKESIDEAKRILGKEGRIVVRPSGTEPLIRVMAEGKDVEEIRRIAENVAGVIEERLGKPAETDAQNGR